MTDRRIRALLAGLDLALIALAGVVALTLRGSIPWLGRADDIDFLLAPVAVPLGLGWWLLLFFWSGPNLKRQWAFGFDEYRRVATMSFVMFTLVTMMLYLTQYPLSRGFILAFFGLGTPLLLLGRWLARRGVHRLRIEGQGHKRTVVVGHIAAVEDLVTVLHRERWLGLMPVGVLLPTAGSALVRGLTVLGSPADVVRVVDEVHAEVVVFCEGAVGRGAEFNDLARRLERHQAQLIVVPSMTDIAPDRISMVPVAGLPLVLIQKPGAARAVAASKRAFDVGFSVVALILAIPLLVVVGALIRREDGGPLVFRQPRVGRDGELFDILKLRSMIVDAETVRDQGFTGDNEAEGPLFKMREDPRVTRIGRFIRRYSIDEIPQFWNVLRGEMSVVGPRPALPSEVESYEHHVRRRLDVRPGMTGLWQVSGRSDLPWEETVRLDLYYVDNWSMIQDLLIIVRTLIVIVRPRGSY